MAEANVEKYLDKNDMKKAGIKTAVSFIPYGSIFTELFEIVIPDYRKERFNAYLEILSGRLSTFDENIIKSKFKNEKFVNLLEESFKVAVNTLTNEKRVYIANIVVNGMTQEDEEYDNKKYMLSLLNELNAVELIILIDKRERMYAGQGMDYYQKHKAILDTCDGFFAKTKEEKELVLLYQNYQKHLTRLGLFSEKQKAETKTGKIKSDGFELSGFGEIFLDYIGIIDESKL